MTFFGQWARVGGCVGGVWLCIQALCPVWFVRVTTLGGWIEGVAGGVYIQRMCVCVCVYICCVRVMYVYTCIRDQLNYE